MKKEFKNRLAAIDWIAATAEHEGQFEVMREQLNYNFIYFGIYFLDTADCEGEVVMKEDKSANKRYL